MVIVVVCSLTGKKIYKLKVNNKNVNIATWFCLRSISEKFNYVESEEVSFTVNVYNFSVVYNAFDKSQILNICKFFMPKNNIK